MKQRGFTLIEVMIVIAILGILGSLILPAMSSKRPVGDGPTPNSISQPAATKSDTECISGYQFIRSGRDLKQIVGSNGGGVSC